MVNVPLEGIIKTFKVGEIFSCGCWRLKRFWRRKKQWWRARSSQIIHSHSRSHSPVVHIFLFNNLHKYLMGCEQHNGYGFQAKPEMGFSDQLSYSHQFTLQAFYIFRCAAFSLPLSPCVCFNFHMFCVFFLYVVEQT